MEVIGFIIFLAIYILCVIAPLCLLVWCIGEIYHHTGAAMDAAWDLYVFQEKINERRTKHEQA